MSIQTIEIRGSYRYTDRHVLERALATAREEICDDELASIDPDWLRSFVRCGTTLQVEAVVPIAADRFVACAVIDALARDAIEGVVELRADGRCVDWFPSRNG